MISAEYRPGFDFKYLSLYSQLVFLKMQAINSKMLLTLANARIQTLLFSLFSCFI